MWAVRVAKPIGPRCWKTNMVWIVRAFLPMEQQFDFFSVTPDPRQQLMGMDQSEIKTISLDEAFRRTKEYEKHIKSAQWRNTREQMFKLRGKKCEQCDATIDLELHHKTYERFGREGPKDLQILCKRHHKIADRKREEDNQREFEALCENTRYENARHTFLTKKYGEMYCPDIFMNQEFEDWLERKLEREWLV